MVDARLTQDKVRLESTLVGVVGFSGDTHVGLNATGLRIEFPGFRRAYVEGTDDPEAELADQERILPPLTEGEVVPVRHAEAKGHDTQPPDRYSEATLIKKLEDLGIGRPSTYASVMKTIDRRGYVWKKGKSLVPAFRAFAVVNLLQAVLRGPGRLPVHRGDGGRPRRDRPGQPGPRAVVAEVLLRRPGRRPSWPVGSST